MEPVRGFLWPRTTWQIFAHKITQPFSDFTVRESISSRLCLGVDVSLSLSCVLSRRITFSGEGSLRIWVKSLMSVFMFSKMKMKLCGLRTKQFEKMLHVTELQVEKLCTVLEEGVNTDFCSLYLCAFV